MFRPLIVGEYQAFLRKASLLLRRCVFCTLVENKVACIANSVSNVCEAAPRSLFRAPNGVNELSEGHFEFPFMLIGKTTMAFLAVHSWRVLKSWYTGGDPEQVFRCCFADGLNQSLVSSVAQDKSNGERETRETGDEA